MNFNTFLSQNKGEIVERWILSAINSYPAETARFLKSKKDRFGNPVGYSINHELNILYDKLVDGKDVKDMSCSIDNLIRLRAVQDLKPSEALGFLFYLKKIIRDKVGSEKYCGSGMADKISTFESRVDEMALLALDIYMECREKVYKLRLDEIKMRSGMPDKGGWALRCAGSDCSGSTVNNIQGLT